jgi:hypothetical protein
MRVFSHITSEGDLYFYCYGDPTQTSSYEFISSSVLVNSLFSVDKKQKEIIHAGSVVTTYDSRVYEYVSGDKNLESSYLYLGSLEPPFCVEFANSISSLTTNQQNKINTSYSPYVITCDGKLYQYINGVKTLQTSYNILSPCLIFGLSLSKLTQSQRNRIFNGCYIFTLNGDLYQYIGGSKTSLISYTKINNLCMPPTPAV